MRHHHPGDTDRQCAVAQVIGVKDVELQVFDQRAKIGGCVLKIVLPVLHPVQPKSARVIGKAVQAIHPRGLVWHGELAAIRRQEFMDSCQILGISRPVVLDYPDGQLYRQEVNRVVYELTLAVRRFRPDVMLTFGPEGGVTGHPDHSMSGIFAGLAFHWAGRPNRYADQLKDGVAPHRTRKLYYAAAGIAIPGRPPITFAPQTTTIDIGDHLETKITASQAHKTQQPLWAMFEENVRKQGKIEHFHLAASIFEGPTRPETDLFSGIAGD